MLLLALVSKNLIPYSSANAWPLAESITLQIKAIDLDGLWAWSSRHKIHLFVQHIALVANENLPTKNAQSVAAAQPRNIPKDTLLTLSDACC